MYFTVKPKHLWHYLTLSFWIRKKIVEEFLNYKFENGYQKELVKQILIYGESHPWKWKGK